MSREHHHPELFDDHRWAVGAAVALYSTAVLVLLVMAVDRSLLQPVDDRWLDAMITIEASGLTPVAKAFDLVGSFWVTGPVRLVVAAFLWSRRRWESLVVWIMTIVVSEAAVSILKALYARERPPDGLVDTTGFSFPSGHAIAGAATAVALVVVLLPAGAHRRIWELAAGLFAFAMAMSRTYLRAHWLTDVIAGVLIGTATALAVAAAVHVWWMTRGRGRAVVPDG